MGISVRTYEQRISALERQVATLLAQVAALEQHTHTYPNPSVSAFFGEIPVSALPSLINTADGYTQIKLYNTRAADAGPPNLVMGPPMFP